MLTPTYSVSEMKALIWEGLTSYATSAAVYIRPMYWGIDGDLTAIVPSADTTGFAISLEEIPFAAPKTSATLGRTQFRRPILESAVVNAKAGCLYPNNARMLVEARRNGFSNALVADAMGNVAETATANIFMARDGEVFTPAPNGTFLAGITRARHITHLKDMGIPIHETILSFDDFYAADEVFMTGNMQKITPVTAIEETHFQIGPIAGQLKEAYWDWASSTSA